MAYSSLEIENITRLVENQHSKNLQLALQLCKSKGGDTSVDLLLYWLGHCLYWENNLHNWQEVSSLLVDETFHLDQALSVATFLSVAHLEKIKPTLSSTQLVWFCNQIFERFSTEISSQYFLKRFLIKYCSTDIQATLIESLKKRDHLGRVVLDLGKLDLEQIPPVFEQPNDIQILSLWGNQLKVLPDIWYYFPKLEELTLVHNDLEELPMSMMHLTNLEKLFLHDNPIQVDKLESLLKQLPNLSYLSLADNASKTTSLPYQRLEILVNHDKIHASIEEKQVYWALLLFDTVSEEKIKFPYLVKALADDNNFIKRAAVDKILHWHQHMTTITPDSHVASLGLLSFATRQHIEQLKKGGYHFEDEIQPKTTHVLLGQDIEPIESLREDLQFVSEQQVLEISI